MSYDFDGSKAEPNRTRILTALGAAILSEAITPAAKSDEGRYSPPTGYVPIATGQLRNSLNYKVEGDSVTVGSQIEYALPMENRFGFLARALDEVSVQAKSIIKANA